MGNHLKCNRTDIITNEEEEVTEDVKEPWRWNWLYQKDHTGTTLKTYYKKLKRDGYVNSFLHKKFQVITTKIDHMAAKNVATIILS